MGKFGFCAMCEQPRRLKPYERQGEAVNLCDSCSEQNPKILPDDPADAERRRERQIPKGIEEADLLDA